MTTKAFFTASEAGRKLDLPLGRVLRAAKSLNLPRVGGRTFLIKPEQLNAVRVAASSTKKGDVSL
jgi:hypothetical protein